MLKKVAFTMYPIRDVARARRFYEDVLGLAVGLNGNQGDKWWIEYDLPGVAASRSRISSPTNRAPRPAARLPSRSRISMRLSPTSSQRAQRSVVQGPNCRMTTCLDTEGNSIILHQRNPKR